MDREYWIIQMVITNASQTRGKLRQNILEKFC